MAKTTIDPAFQAAPYLGDSSFDPVDFSRRQKTLKNRAQERRRDEEDANLAKGLDKLMIDVKGWEDQEGFKEIMQRQDKSLKLFTELSKKGLNLTSPKSSQEVEAYRAINQYHAETKQMVDEWDRNKKAYDIVTEAIKQDATKPESERRIDSEATRANVNKAMQGKTIAERKLELEKLLVFKPELGDVDKYVKDNLYRMPKPDIISEPVTDPNTGQTINRQREVETPEFIKEKEKSMRTLFATMPKPEKNLIKQLREKDPNLDVMTDEDYFVSMYMPSFKQKFIDKAVGKASSGLDLNFLGSKTKLEPGNQRMEPLVYGDKTFTGVYTFKPTTKPFVVPVGDKLSSQFAYSNWMPIEKGGTVEATLYAYDPKTDMFIFNTTAGNKTPWVDNNTPVMVPRSVIGKDADNLPIMVGGEQKKLKDIYGAAPLAEKKKFSVTWSQEAYTGKGTKK